MKIARYTANSGVNIRYGIFEIEGIECNKGIKNDFHCIMNSKYQIDIYGVENQVAEEVMREIKDGFYAFPSQYTLVLSKIEE